MHLLRPFLCALITLCISPSFAADLPPITDWREIKVPPKAQQGDSWVEWHVYLKNDRPHAMLTRDFKTPGEKPNFTPTAKKYTAVSDTLRVEDGWLVGFNQGEWGGALYWFSPDGKKNYKISDHQVVDLFVHQNVIHAIEGVSHLSLSRGSIITVTRPKNRSRWKSQSVLKLPAAPAAVATLSDRMLIVLGNSIVSVTPEYALTLLSEAPWNAGLYPNSCVLATNQTTLYVGMRQYVGELDLQTRQVRLLIPSDEFIHKLPQKDADRIKKAYAGGELEPAP